MSRKEGPIDWLTWTPWARKPELCPAGAVTVKQRPVAEYDRPLVTVVIPCGPSPLHRKLVKTAVDSVEAQTIREWECIVVYDGTAFEPELPAWVKTWRITDQDGKPRGVAAARNWGVEKAKAPMFLPLDADDYLQPDALRMMLDAHVKTRDIIYSDFYEDPKEEGKFTIWQLPDWDANLLRHGTIHAVTALTPVSVWRDVGGYDTTKPAWEDWDFQLRCADKGVCSRRITAPLFTYRKHTGTRRNDNVRNFEESKNGILSSWHEIWEGTKTLAACGSCGARASVQPAWAAPSMAMGATPQKLAADSVMMVEYVGPRKASVQFKGVSGTYYQMGGGAPAQMVLAQDLHIFVNRPNEFRIMAPTLAGVEGTPSLVAG
jgi:hypothetical protein